jgi:hypothetical protein
MKAYTSSQSEDQERSRRQNVVHVTSESNQIKPEVLTPQQHCRGKIKSRKLMFIS